MYPLQLAFCVKLHTLHC